MKLKLAFMLLLICHVMTMAQYNYYDSKAGWIPDNTSPVKTIRVRFNIIQDASGNGNFNENNPQHVAYLQALQTSMNGLFINYANFLQCGESNNIYDTRVRLQFMPTNYIKNNTLYNYEILNNNNCPGPNNWVKNYNDQLEASNSLKAINIYFHNPPSCYQHYQSLGFVETFDNNGPNGSLRSVPNTYCSGTLHSDGIPGGCSMLPVQDAGVNSYMAMNACHLDYERKKASAVASYRTAFNNPSLFWNENNPAFDPNNVYFWALGIYGNVVHEVVHALINDVIHHYEPCCANLMGSGNLDNCTNPVGNGTYLKMAQLGSIHYSLTNLNTKKYVVEDRCNFNASIPITITGTVDWNTSRNLNSNITVESGAILNVNSSVALSGGATILVKAGGTLNINDKGSITHNCCSSTSNLLFDIKGIMNVNSGGALAFKTGYSYQVAGNLSLNSGAVLTKHDNIPVTIIGSGTYSENSGMINCHSSISLNNTSVTTGGYYLANGSITLNNTSVASSSLPSITFKSNASLAITPASPLNTLTGTNVLLEIGNNRCLANCIAQQYRMEQAANPLTPCVFDDPVKSLMASNAKEGDSNIISDQVSQTVFPNPIFTGYLNFGRQVSYYSLTDNTGVVIKQGNNVEKIDISALPKGVYSINLDGNVEKIVIQ